MFVVGAYNSAANRPIVRCGQGPQRKYDVGSERNDSIVLTWDTKQIENAITLILSRWEYTM